MPGYEYGESNSGLYYLTSTWDGGTSLVAVQYVSENNSIYNRVVNKIFDMSLNRYQRNFTLGNNNSSPTTTTGNNESF